MVSVNCFAGIESQKPWLPNPDIHVSHYKINLIVPNLKATKLAATAVLTIKKLPSAATIQLNVERETILIKKILLNGASATFSVLNGVAGANHLSGDVLDIKIPKALSKKTDFTVTVDYEICIKTERHWGLVYKNFHGEDVINSNGWPYYSRYWIPSNDHPSDLATYDIELHVPQNTIGLSNGELRGGNIQKGSSQDKDHLKVYSWHMDQKMPTYDLNVVIGNFEIYQQDLCYSLSDDWLKPNGPVNCKNPHQFKIPLSFFNVKAIDPAAKFHFLENARAAGDALPYFSSLWENYRFAKLGYVQAPHPWNMEYSSMITVIGPSSMTHELIHHWWGNSVFLNNWGDRWLIEGFTTFFDMFYREIKNEDTASSCDYRKEGVLDNRSDSDPMATFSPVDFCKGSLTLSDLRKTIGELVHHDEKSREVTLLFLQLFHDFFIEYRQKGVNTKDFVLFVQTHLLGILPRANPSVDSKLIQSKILDWQNKWFSQKYINVSQDKIFSK